MINFGLKGREDTFIGNTLALLVGSISCDTGIAIVDDYACEDYMTLFDVEDFTEKHRYELAKKLLDGVKHKAYMNLPFSPSVNIMLVDRLLPVFDGLSYYPAEEPKVVDNHIIVKGSTVDEVVDIKGHILVYIALVQDAESGELSTVIGGMQNSPFNELIAAKAVFDVCRTDYYDYLCETSGMNEIEVHEFIETGSDASGLLEADE